MRIIFTTIFLVTSIFVYAQTKDSTVTFIVKKKPTTNSSNIEEFIFNENKEDIFLRAEKMPEFPGGNDSLSRFIIRKLEYPQEAIDNKITGTVVVRFVVDELGNATQNEILKSVSPALDKAAIDVINSLPKFTPAQQGGKAVKAYFILPIRFDFQK